MNPDAYLEMAQTEAAHWWFVGRRAILAEVIRSLGVPPDAQILEIGAGTGGNLEMLSRFGSVCAVEMDANARALASAKTGGRFDIRAGTCPDRLPHFGHSFDLVCMFDVLEHIDDDKATLDALHSLVRPGARLIVTVPAYRWLWGPHDEHLHHKRRYTLLQLRHLTSECGWSIDVMTYFNTLLFPLALLARGKDRLIGGQKSTGVNVPAEPLNAMLSRVFAAERWLVGRMRLPFGVSLLAVLSKH